MKKFNQKGFSVVEGLLIVVAIAIIGGAGFYVYNANKNTNQSLDNTGNSEIKKAEEKKKSESKEKEVAYGTIKGQSSYPSEGLPMDEEICAQDANNSAASPICINVGQKQVINFELKVPVGTYHVYAQTSKM